MRYLPLLWAGLRRRPARTMLAMLAASFLFSVFHGVHAGADPVFVIAIVGALLSLAASSMVQSIRERAPEFAMLRIVGFSELRVRALIVTEALVIGAAAALIGLAVATTLRAV